MEDGLKYIAHGGQTKCIQNLCLKTYREEIIWKK